MLNNKKIAVIGAGKMGETLIRGLLDAQAIEASAITITAAHRQRVEHLVGELKVNDAPNNTEAVRDADLILLCVKPYAITEVVREIQNSLKPPQLLLSVAASVGTSLIERELNRPVPVIRAMPNTPCSLKRGMTGLARGTHATEEHMDFAKAIFEQVGRVVLVDEKHMDAVTGLSASGPAFIYIIIESLAEAGVKTGLPRDIATELAAQTVLGAASMVVETGEHPAKLKDAVTTPAGCTIDGILELEDGGLRVTLIKAVVKATERARELVAS